MNLRVGDKVLAYVDDDIMEDEEVQGQNGSIIGFVGSLVKVSLEIGGEQLLARERVVRVKEDGLYLLWVATGSNHTLHRCEVLIQRRITIALENDFSLDNARCSVRPRDLVKGMRVWPKKKDALDKREGPGMVMSAAPDVGLCSVTWANGSTEVAVAADLEKVRDTVA